MFGIEGANNSTFDIEGANLNRNHSAAFVEFESPTFVEFRVEVYIRQYVDASLGVEGGSFGKPYNGNGWWLIFWPIDCEIETCSLTENAVFKCVALAKNVNRELRSCSGHGSNGS